MLPNARNDCPWPILIVPASTLDEARRRAHRKDDTREIVLIVGDWKDMFSCWKCMWCRDNDCIMGNKCETVTRRFKR